MISYSLYRIVYIAHILYSNISTSFKLVKGTWGRHGGDNQVWYIMQQE